MTRRTALLATAALAVAGIGLSAGPGSATTGPTTAPRPTKVATRPSPATGGGYGLRQDAVVRRHALTGEVRFMGSSTSAPIARPSVSAPDRTPTGAARAFLDRQGAAFGLSGGSKDLVVHSVQPATGGRSIVRLQQTYDGVPVMAGDLVVDVTGSDAIRSASGEVSPGLSLSTQPAVSAAHAAETARGIATKAAHGATLQASDPSLWVYDSRLLGTPGKQQVRLVWRTEVTSPDRPDVREMVLVDAQTGQVVLHMDEVETVRNRLVCDAGNTTSQVPCAAPYARVEGGAATGIADVDLAYDYAGGVYDFYKNRFNRDSIDNAGMPMVQTVRYCESSGCPLENAFWNGSQMVYGTDYASADDVVGHEMTHGVTERTSGLFYWFQSGAINESLSDVFGELFDLTDGQGNDSPAVRWKLGEDLPIGAIRDMQSPGAFGDPDSMTSPNYSTGFDGQNIVDSGGVHTNSGVNNKAASLMTDGGTFNGRTVTGLGVDKVAQIYYEVDANILSSGSDYQDLYDGLYQACQNLVMVGRLASSDCTQVRNATLAVAMNQQPNGGSFPAVPEAPVCAPGRVPTDLFYDNLENGTGSWVPQTTAGVNHWGNNTGYSPSGRHMLYTDDPAQTSDASVVKAVGTAIPTGATTYVRFSQATNFEAGLDTSSQWGNYDGGVVEYSVDGGRWRDLGPLMVDNGYNGTISTDFGNPLAGRRAYTWASGGTFSTRAALSSLAGHRVRVRFRIGADSGNFQDSFWGWTVDDVRYYTCSKGSRPAGSATTNLLRNGGFEWDDNDDAYADFWSRNLGALRTPGAQRTGHYGLTFTAADNAPYVVGQRVPVTAGKSYRASVAVRIPTTSRAVSFTVKVQYRDSSGKLVGTSRVRSYTDDTAGAWTAPSVVTVAPAGATSATFLFVQDGVRARVLVDNALFRLS